MKKNKTIIDDGFASYLVEGSEFDGKWEIPLIKFKTKIIPSDLIPFDKRFKVPVEKRKGVFIHFYMYDSTFRQIITNTDKYLDDLREFGGIISPDCSLYVDMPLACQIGNTYMNRAIGSYLQKQGINVIPNIRWGDERSYEFAFDGVEKGAIYSIGTHGCIKTKQEKYYFREGLREMLKRLEPKLILVHGSMPNEVFDEFKYKYKFILYESYIARVKGKGVYYG